MIDKLRRSTPRVGFFAVGHSAYWAQFPGLRERLCRHHAAMGERIGARGAEIVEFGLIDESTAAYDAVDRIAGARLDVLFVDMVTYATSSVFAPIVVNTRLPIVLIAVQPLAELDYTRASTEMQLENDNICSVPEFIGVAERLGNPVTDVVIGHFEDDPAVDEQLAEWIRIASALNGVRRARLGLMGHVLESMYDMHADPTAITATFGCHVPLLEVDDVIALRREVTDARVEAEKARILSLFDTPDPESDPVTRRLTAADLEASARTSVALHDLAEKYSLDGLAYYYEGLDGSEHRDVVGSFIVGNSLLIAAGVPMCGEADIKTCIAMLIMERMGIGGSFAEFHPFDFAGGFILLGHDGPHHVEIADGRPVLRSLVKYHGKPGHGASVEFTIKEGPITMLSISLTREGRFRFVVGEGESRRGPIPPTGNTNTRAFFEPDVRSFVKKWVMAGPTHHFALGIGHHARTIEKLARALGVECRVVD
ncbi:MAG: arabinose isomerase [Spirochaetaceae bacterium]|nr:MAG: arabinose isomerase [Spirochaetaceae bacterium]